MVGYCRSGDEHMASLTTGYFFKDTELNPE